MSLVARPDQVAELTRGVQLPLPDIAWPLLQVLVSAVKDAWKDLVAAQGPSLHAKSETELTTLLQSHLNHARGNSIKLGQIVSCVVRGAESISFDGSHIEKRPDLSVYMTARNANFPLVVECKIIDHERGKGIDLYCSKGVKRFVDGEYGWASAQAFMIAYVCDDSSVDNTLTPHLETAAGSRADPFRTRTLPSFDRHMNALTTSEHDRSFRYINFVANDDPGPIAISHVWIDVPGPNDFLSGAA